RGRLRAQANQLGGPPVVRLVDLLAVVGDDVRQGGDPRLPLEVGLAKVTRPGADLARESLAYRIEQLETRGGGAPPAVVTPPERPEPKAPSTSAPPDLELEQLRDAWSRAVVPAVAERSIPISTVLGDARPAQLAGDTRTGE